MEEGLILLGTGPIFSNPYAEFHVQFAEMGLLNSRKILVGNILIIGFLYNIDCEHEHAITVIVWITISLKGYNAETVEVKIWPIF